MAYVEIWRNGRLLARRRIEGPQARKGCRIRLGPTGVVYLALGQTRVLGAFEVRMRDGEPPVRGAPEGETGPGWPPDDLPLPPLSVGSPGLQPGVAEAPPDIPGYRVLGPLGRGGMGMVWRAEQLSTRRQVALKLLVARRFESARAQARFSARGRTDGATRPPEYRPPL